jgi:c-di-GMP-binding flagellar brake protein YcgR
LAFHWDESACHIAQPKSIERVQRRQSFRLEKIIDVQYKALLSFDADSDPDRIAADRPAVAKNISEGGALLVLNDRFMGSETFLKVQITLDVQVVISALARVLDQKPHPEVPGKVITRVQFVTIKENDKDEIRKFVLLHSRKGG